MRCLGPVGSRKKLRASVRSFGTLIVTVTMYDLRPLVSRGILNPHRLRYWWLRQGPVSGVLCLGSGAKRAPGAWIKHGAYRSVEVLIT